MKKRIAINNTSPIVSVIILNWNGKKWLSNCLKSWEKVMYASKEIIVVNNGSTDDSGEFVKKTYPEIRLLELQKNIGFAGANNLGVSKAKGKYVLLLNNDTVVTPGFLEVLVQRMEKSNSIGAVQPQIRSLIDKRLLDSVVSYLTPTGFMYHFGYMKPYTRDIYQKPLCAYSIKGACFLMRKSEYTALGGLDEDFVCYVEESDLCHRIWLSGKEVWYEPESIVYHWGGGDMQVMTKDETTMFRSYRNRITSHIKNLSMKELIKTLPLHLLFCEGFVIMTLMNGGFKKAAGAQLGIVSSFFILPQTLKKRMYIQKNIRKVKDMKFMSQVKRTPRLSYYYHFFKNPSGYID